MFSVAFARSQGEGSRVTTAELFKIVHFGNPPWPHRADPRGYQGRVPPRDPNSFSWSFRQKKWKIIDYHTHFGSWRPLRKILDTPLHYNATIQGPATHVQNVFTCTSPYRDPRKCSNLFT